MLKIQLAKSEMDQIKSIFYNEANSTLLLKINLPFYV